MQDTEVFGALDQADTEELLPESIDGDASCERVFGGNEPLLIFSPARDDFIAVKLHRDLHLHEDRQPVQARRLRPQAALPTGRELSCRQARIGRCISRILMASTISASDKRRTACWSKKRSTLARDRSMITVI